RALGFPTSRDEEWRFTSVAPIAERPFALARNGASTLRHQDLDPLRLPIEPAATLVFVNGRSVPALSAIGPLPPGVSVASMTAGALADVVDATAPGPPTRAGGGLVRNDVTAGLDGEGGECTLNGLYFGDRRTLVDNHTTIDHARPHCASREIYKGILADHARAVFNGKIIVRPDAQKTDAKQTNKALLLSEDAQINTKPQLEIFANDVKCTHGAAVGQMDEDAIFYLRSRGLSQHEARTLLIHAFAGDVLNRMKLETLRPRLDEELMRRLSGVQ